MINEGREWIFLHALDSVGAGGGLEFDRYSA